MNWTNSNPYSTRKPILKTIIRISKQDDDADPKNLNRIIEIGKQYVQSINMYIIKSIESLKYLENFIRLNQ